MANKSKRNKILLWSALGLLVILLLIAVTQKKGGPEIKVTTEQVTKRTIVETVSANGKIQPEKDIKISPYISGEVVDLYVKEGDEVEKGDLLAKIDPEIYKTNYEQIEASLKMQQANLANARARLAQANAQFVKAEEDFKRNEKLFEQQVISQSDYDGALSAFEVAKAEVKAAEENVKAAEFSVSSSEATLREAGENLKRTAIYAPDDGTVSRLSVEKGERVTGASQFSAGTEIMRIANLSRMIVLVEVNENDIVRVSNGDTCIIEVDAYLEEKFRGVVLEMATSANVTGVSADQVTNFEVKILILEDSYDHLLSGNMVIRSPFRPGMSATVEIQTQTANNILTVPIQAVTTRPDTANKENDRQQSKVSGENSSAEKEDLVEVVFLFQEGKALMRKVKTGVQDNMYIRILDGANEGDEIITGPYRAVSDKLKDGDPVQKVDRKELFTED
ncbi:MAG: efflux RND transporter periplasmic adaptor subunit [Bacteroidales bacterium]|nr:efflux RND transporter periplasmic adaptor subunit [Bacteroidales bacterium]